MFHRVFMFQCDRILPAVQCDAIFSLAMLYNVIRHRTIILVVKLITVVFLFVVVFVLISESKETPSDNILYTHLTSKCTAPLNIHKIRSPCCYILSCFLLRCAVLPAPLSRQCTKVWLYRTEYKLYDYIG